MKMKFPLVLLTLFIASGVFAQEGKPAIPEVDRVRLAEAFRIGETLGNKVWKDWDQAPFAVLLITPENEFLIRHPQPSEDFTPIGYDSLLRSSVYFRKRTQLIALEATFPAVKGSPVPTIVVGQAENTQSKTSSPWVVTMLHEHFHQLQYTQPNYYAEADALNLSRGDQTGMWMLNYAFPYSASEVKQPFNRLSRLLAEALKIRLKKDFLAKATAYLEARRRFNAMLSPDDYRYLSFQLWQEGAARYTEYQVAKLAAADQPSTAFRALDDHQSFQKVADQTLQRILEQLMTLQLDDSRREAFYSLGAGEALLLDRLNPAWKQRYFKDKFYVDKYFNAAP